MKQSNEQAETKPCTIHGVSESLIRVFEEALADEMNMVEIESVCDTRRCFKNSIGVKMFFGKKERYTIYDCLFMWDRATKATSLIVNDFSKKDFDEIIDYYKTQIEADVNSR